MSELYNHINRLCKERGTNMTALCRDAKVARAALSELNRGRTKTITLETAGKLADTLGISIDELMGAEQKEKAPIDVVDEDLRDYLDELRNRPEMRMLFSTTKTATKAQIEAIVKMVEEMQGDK